MVTELRKIEENKRESSNIGMEGDMLIISEYTSTFFSQQVKARIAVIISPILGVNKVH